MKTKPKKSKNVSPNTVALVRAEAKGILFGFERMADAEKVALATKISSQRRHTNAEAVALAEILDKAQEEGKLHLYVKAV